MSLKAIRGLLDQAGLDLDELEAYEAEIAELAKVPEFGFDRALAKREGERKVSERRGETSNARLGGLVLLQSRLEKACEAVAREVKRYVR